MIFNASEWKNKISDPLWYQDVPQLISALQDLRKRDRNAYEREKESMYVFFEQALRGDEVSLGESGPDWDEERKSVDTVVIHHTSNPSGMTKQRLSAMTLLRLYARSYAEPNDDNREKVVGQPIWSSHLRDGEQVFYPYHWIVRMDGIAERLLNRNEIGWQAGSWEVNMRSVGIVLDNDYENEKPSDVVLKATADVIREQYTHVLQENVIGHCEVERTAHGPRPVCPSRLFLGKSGWKRNLAALLK